MRISNHKYALKEIPHADASHDRGLYIALKRFLPNTILRLGLLVPSVIWSLGISVRRELSLRLSKYLTSLKLASAGVVSLASSLPRETSMLAFSTVPTDGTGSKVELKEQVTNSYPRLSSWHRWLPGSGPSAVFEVGEGVVFDGPVETGVVPTVGSNILLLPSGDGVATVGIPGILTHCLVPGQSAGHLPQTALAELTHSKRFVTSGRIRATRSVVRASDGTASKLSTCRSRTAEDIVVFVSRAIIARPESLEHAPLKMDEDVCPGAAVKWSTMSRCTFELRRLHMPMIANKDCNGLVLPSALSDECGWRYGSASGLHTGSMCTSCGVIHSGRSSGVRAFIRVWIRPAAPEKPVPFAVAKAAQKEESKEAAISSVRRVGQIEVAAVAAFAALTDGAMKRRIVIRNRSNIAWIPRMFAISFGFLKTMP